MKTRVYVNKHIVRRNQRAGEREPVLTVSNYKSTVKAHEVTFHGPSQLVYRPDKPLSCGATVWLETLGEVTVK